MHIEQTPLRDDRTDLGLTPIAQRVLKAVATPTGGLGQHVGLKDMGALLPAFLAGDERFKGYWTKN
ncbi:MAG TPA: hypothetical protein EYN67_02030 [Flavobacteriales bacterium]|nr:hypothetical protein [Flavobacteriales bacterium]